MIPHTPKCFQSHMGVWAVEPKAADRHLSNIRCGMVHAEEPTPLQTEMHDGILYLPLSGTLMKARSKYGGTSTVDARREIARANRNDEVNGIALVIDSPGGTADGTDELFDAVSSSNKPVRVYTTYAASAAYWVAAGAESITVSKMGLVGSIGTYMVLADTSGAMEMEGVKMHLVSSGGVKGHGADGKVTPELLQEAQKIVDFSDSFFAAGVRQGRGLDEDAEKAVHTGQMFTPDEAMVVGLVDHVSTFEEFITTFADDVRPKSKDRSRSRAAQDRLRGYRG